MASINTKLERTRKPRVHIKYEVETENGVVEKELPFVVGVLGDFSGNPVKPLKPLKQRKFIKIDKDNFNEVMAKQTPGLKFNVNNTLDNGTSDIAIELRFNSLEDFSPQRLVEQVPQLKKLKNARDKLRDLLSKSDRSDQLEQILENALQDPKKLLSLATDLGIAQQQGENDDR